MIKKIFVLLLLFIVLKSVGQELFDEEKNTINNKEYIQDFYNKLTNKTATILHIGDSHIQANFFTGKLRELFQEEFGQADRGITFPLGIANTNGHTDIRYYSDIEWERNRIIEDENKNVGISGITIFTKEPKFFIKLVNKKNVPISQIRIIGKGLNKLKIGIPNTVIHTYKTLSQQKIYKVNPGDYLYKISRKFKVSVKQLKRWNHLKNDKLSIGQKLIVRAKLQNKAQNLNPDNFNFIEPASKSDTELIIDLQSTISELYFINSTITNNTTTKIDGIFINNNSEKGITYHSIGINGAKYADYNKSDLFFEQLKMIKPNLIILSLGTNEAFDKHYENEKFYEEVSLFFEKLKKNTNCKSILLTTPPSSLIRKKYPNHKLNDFTNILIKIAEINNFSVWNLYDIMGRENGMKNWNKQGLSSKDKIHFTKEGYLLQAQLLYKALLKND